MDMPNHELIEYHESTNKVPQGGEWGSKEDRDQLINEKADLFDNMLRLEE